MKFVQPPLKISCDGLSKKRVYDLANRLSPFFHSVSVVSDDTIFCHKPNNNSDYAFAWEIIDEFGVKAA